MERILKYLGIILLILLTGCSTFKTRNYSPPQWAKLGDRHLKSFIGKNISHAQQIYGYKFKVNPLDARLKAYVWEMNRQTGFGFSFIGSTKTVHCNWAFITDPTDKIIDYHRFGYCPSAVSIN